MNDIPRPKLVVEEPDPATSGHQHTVPAGIDAFNQTIIGANLKGATILPKPIVVEKQKAGPSPMIYVLYIVLIAFIVSSSYMVAGLMGFVDLPAPIVRMMPALDPKQQENKELPVLPSNVIKGKPTDLAETLTPTSAASPTSADRSIATPEPTQKIPGVDLSKPTVRCKDGTERIVEYQQGACSFHDGLSEVLQPIPEMPAQ